MSRAQTNLIPNYEPFGVFGLPSQKGSIEETAESMGAVIATLMASRESVTREDLHRHGFDDDDIAKCHAAAARIANGRLVPVLQTEAA